MIWLAGWCALFGVWPVAEPAHDMDTLGGAVDVVVHAWGVLALIRWWPSRRAVR